MRHVLSAICQPPPAHGAIANAESSTYYAIVPSDLDIKARNYIWNNIHRYPCNPLYFCIHKKISIAIWTFIHRSHLLPKLLLSSSRGIWGIPLELLRNSYTNSHDLLSQAIHSILLNKEDGIRISNIHGRCESIQPLCHLLLRSAASARMTVRIASCIASRAAAISARVSPIPFRAISA